MKIYTLKPSFSVQRRLPTNKTMMLNDDVVFDISEAELCKRDIRGRGNNLNVDQKYTGDFSKITDVHFIKGTGFDRDYFRRLYPNINIRIKPELANVIIYDEHALFSNDNVAKYAVEFLHNDEPAYIMSGSSQLNIVVDVVQNPLSFTGRAFGPVSVEPKSVLDSYLTAYKAGKYKGVYLGEKNIYFNLLTALKKPYMHVNEVLNKFSSSLRQNNLSLEECITYLHQIKSGDAEIMKAALESILMYNTDKYAPLQCLFCSIYNKEMNSNRLPTPKSNKIILFYNSNRDKIVAYGDSHNIFQLLSMFSVVCTSYFTAKTIEWDLIRNFVLSDEFTQGLGQMKDAPHVKIKGITFEFDKKSPLYLEPKNECSEIVKNISEFIV